MTHERENQKTKMNHIQSHPRLQVRHVWSRKNQSKANENITGCQEKLILRYNYIGSMGRGKKEMNQLKH